MNERERKEEMVIQRGEDYFGSEQTPNDASIPAAVTQNSRGGKGGREHLFMLEKQ